MTDFIANDDDGRWDADRVALFAETEQRSWENHRDRWPEANDDAYPPASHRQPTTTATASWQRSVLIIAALSALAWAGVTLVVVAALSAL
jgi:hypothetical protein